MPPGKLLLLVEDETLLAQTLEDALLEAGFALRTLHDGISARRALEDQPEAFQALITDVRLSNDGPDGFDLAHRARELSPSIAVLYITGAAAADWAAKGVPKSVILQKPFALAQLVTAVATLLNEAPM